MLKQLDIAKEDSRDALYLDPEDRDGRNRLAEPALFLDNLEDRLVILDEIHRMPELFQTLRGIIDRGRPCGKGKGRFLILGSASIDLLRQSGESLEHLAGHPVSGRAGQAMSSRRWCPSCRRERRRTSTGPVPAPRLTS